MDVNNVQLAKEENFLPWIFEREQQILVPKMQRALCHTVQLHCLLWGKNDPHQTLTWLCEPYFSHSMHIKFDTSINIASSALRRVVSRRGADYDSRTLSVFWTF